MSTVWLTLGGMMVSLRLSTGGFPKPLTAEEEQHYLNLAAQGDLEARKFSLADRWRNGVRVLRKKGEGALECGVGVI